MEHPTIWSVAYYGSPSARATESDRASEWSTTAGWARRRPSLVTRRAAPKAAVLQPRLRGRAAGGGLLTVSPSEIIVGRPRGSATCRRGSHGNVRALPVIAGLRSVIARQAQAASARPPDRLAQRVLDATAGLHAPGGAGVAPAGPADRMLGALRIPGGLHGDVWAHGDHACVGPGADRAPARA